MCWKRKDEGACKESLVAKSSSHPHAIIGVPPEVTDLDLALEPWKKVYLPVMIK